MHSGRIPHSDGDIQKFRTEVTPKTSMVLPLSQYNLKARSAPMDTTKGTLEALGFSSNTLMMINGDLYEYGTDLYNPKRFKYTRVDGTEYVIHTEKGIESVTDAYGHKLTYDEGGISHSSGENISITFKRDAANRIELVKDCFGNEVVYRYGADGSLEEA